MNRPNGQLAPSQRYGGVAVSEVSQAALRLAMAASEMERIDLAILRIDREIERQRLRKIALLEERAALERAISIPLRSAA